MFRVFVKQVDGHLPFFGVTTDYFVVITKRVQPMLTSHSQRPLTKGFLASLMWMPASSKMSWQKPLEFFVRQDRQHG